jgi:hypothetical protein
MEEGWTLIYTINQLYKAEIATQSLSEKNIQAVAINKKDSSYASFGEDEVYVKNEDTETARQIIKDLNLE